MSFTGSLRIRLTFGQDPARPRVVAGVAAGIMLQVVLLLLLRLPEVADGLDFGGDPARLQVAGSHIGNSLERSTFLLIVLVVDR